MFTSRSLNRTLPAFRRSPPSLPRPPPSSKPQSLGPAQWCRNQGRYRRFDGANAPFRGVNHLIRWSQHPYFYHQAAGLGLLAGGFYIYNLETVPVSGRRRFNVISAEYERAIGEQGYRQVMQQYRNRVLPEGDPRVRLVRRVLDRLVPAAGLGSEEEGWEVSVIDAPGEKNAFVIPGGKVFVFTGLLPVCGGEEGLAVVLGHEIAHNVAHHSAEKTSKSGLGGLMLVIAGLFLGVSGDLPGMLYSIGFDLPNSRTHESEADYIGLLILAQSCYNPSAAVRLWQRMQSAEPGVAPPQLLSTHPNSKNRELKIQEWLPQAMDKYNASECGVTAGFMDEFQTRFL